MKSAVNKLRSNALKFDYIDPDHRSEILLSHLKNQIVYARNSTLFWHDRFEKYAIEPSNINSWKNWQQLPPLKKDEIREVTPWALIPEIAYNQVSIIRTTSGSTGKPTTTLWTISDWRALSSAVARMLSPYMPVDKIRALNCYHQGHLTGPLYDAAIRCLGGLSIPRSHVDEVTWPTTEQIAEMKCNTIVIAEGPGTNKTGTTMNDLLANKHVKLSDSGVKWWIGSSSTFSQGTIASVKDEGITAVTNLLGSSEFGLFAVSCTEHYGHFHLSEGHVLVEVVDDEGCQVSNGQRGRILVSAISGLDENLETCTHEGTQLFRLDIQNETTFHTDICECGLSTNRISDIKRI